MDNIGWIGSLLLAFCGLPQAITAIKTKSGKGISWIFLIMWFIGELFTLIYIWPKSDMPLIINYSANLAFLLIIIYYKIWDNQDILPNIKKPIKYN